MRNRAQSEPRGLPVLVTAPAARRAASSAAPLDDLVGLDLVAAMTPARREHFHLQIGSGIPRPIVSTGHAPFMHLPPPEPRTLVRARMAAEIARAVSSNGCVTDDDLRGFTRAEIEDLFTEARRIARVDRMVA